MEPQGTSRHPKEIQVFEELHCKPALQNCPSPPSPLLQSALERKAKAIRAQKTQISMRISQAKKKLCLDKYVCTEKPLKWPTETLPVLNLLVEYCYLKHQGLPLRIHPWCTGAQN